jgi:hypothetical protein
MPAQPKTIDVEKAKGWLGGVWFGTLIVILVFFVWQNHVVGKYGPDKAAVWEWFLNAFAPALAPTSAFVLGIIVFTKPVADHVHVSRRSFQVAILATILYLLLVIGLIIAEPIFHSGPAEEWLKQSSPMLLVTQTLIQGLVDVSLASIVIRSDTVTSAENRP